MLHCFMLASLLNVLLWYSMCSLKTLSDIIYLPHKFQIKCVETIFLLNAALCFLQTRLQIHSKRGCNVTLAALDWYVVQHFLFYGDKDKHVILQNWTSFHIFHKIPPQAGICSFGCTFGVRMPAKPQESPKTMPDALSRSRFWEIHIQKNMQDHARSCENVISSSILIVTKESQESQVFNQFSCQTCGAVRFLF